MSGIVITIAIRSIAKRALTDTLTRLFKRPASVVLMIFRESKGCQAGKVAWIHAVLGNDVDVPRFR